jgi:excisionase family DNA binding protein
MDIERAFAGISPFFNSPILSPRMLAQLLQLSTKTIYEWIAKGRLDGAFRKRGKHVLLWRDRVIELLFNGADWNHGRKLTNAFVLVRTS